MGSVLVYFLICAYRLDDQSRIFFLTLARCTSQLERVNKHMACPPTVLLLLLDAFFVCGHLRYLLTMRKQQILFELLPAFHANAHENISF
ncbi:hypothetical protein NDU88_004469 [Pleurodeles waltl]|uniref:Secreted protein n=1 Tax=Pleurodeles waltl TaxID=8319 RepID=A0AAV7WVW5_PLEWA|nr:hypothetical protein NDU88_004469 [Pleurodeles waltl]